MADPADPVRDPEAWLAFLRAAGALKDVPRNSWTAAGRRESVAEHSWRLALLGVALAEALPGIDRLRLLELLIVHDLGEAIGGDVPAPLQAGRDRRAAERADLAQVLAPLPPAPAARLAALWEECAAAETPEARLAKALDRLETVLQHVEGANPPDFDYAFNLGYGREWTDAHPVVAALRAPVDAQTARRAAAPAAAADAEWVFQPEPPASLAVAGRTARFPVSRVFCVARNYEAHAAEMGSAVDREAPFYFTKSATAVVPSGGTAPYPQATRDYQHEIELALAIGTGGAEIPVEAALGHVFGYAAALDMTRRDLQAEAKAKSRPWDLGKDVEASAIVAPIAPGSVPPRGRIRLEVDGAARQDADLAEMVWSPAEIVAHLSRFYRLRPGNLILTGTPAGVGPVVPGARLRGVVADLPALDIVIGPAR